MNGPAPQQYPCDSCREPIILVAVENNAGRPLRRMPLNPDPDPDGNVAVRCDVTQTWRGRVLGKGQKPAGGEELFCPHFATCSSPEAHRRRQRGRWSTAQARHSAQLRNRRGRRTAPDPGPGMFTIGGGR